MINSNTYTYFSTVMNVQLPVRILAQMVFLKTREGKKYPFNIEHQTKITNPNVSMPIRPLIHLLQFLKQNKTKKRLLHTPHQLLSICKAECCTHLNRP